jgi:outer membrane lipoprotein-sorting protein
VTAVGVVVAAAAAASASVPSLPHRTAAQLLAEVAQGTAKPLGPFTATVQVTANLGLPQLPQNVQPGGTTGLTSGTQSITIWYGDAQHLRLAEPVQAGESDLRLGGRTLWLWNSKTQTATRYDLPAHFTGPSAHGGNEAAVPKSSLSAGSAANPSSLTPAAAASQVLKAIGPSTVVAVQSNVTVAGRPAYQLALVPRSSQSLVGQVLIAIDASRDIPLRVEVLGRGSGGLVYSVGFTSLSFGAPDASNFSFTPPPGATVKTQVVPSSFQSALTQSGLSSASPGVPGLGASTSGKLPAVPPIPKQALATINAQFAKSLPASMSKAQRAAAIQKFDQRFTTGAASAVNNGGGFANIATPAQAGKPRVIGTDWLSVVATPPSPAVAAAVQGLLNSSGPGSQGQAKQSLFGSSSSSASSPVSSTLTINAGPGPNLAALQPLLLATTAVHGNWGSGRLLQTTLLTVLITSKGQILAGPVTPDLLYADVAADAA